MSRGWDLMAEVRVGEEMDGEKVGGVGKRRYSGV